MGNQRLQRIQALTKYNRWLSDAIRWIEQQRAANHFRGSVLGPICVEVELTDVKFGCAVNKQIPFFLSNAFVFTDKTDQKQAQDASRANRWPGFTTIFFDQRSAESRPSLSRVSQVFPSAVFLDEVIKAPEEVMKTLRERAGIHRVVRMEFRLFLDAAL